MILEAALAHSTTLTKHSKQILLGHKQNTRRFVFNRDASHKQGRFATDYIDILCRNARYAVPPYPNTYIEVDNRALMEGGYSELLPDCAERLGYWWTMDGACFILAGDEKRAEFSPFIYTPVTSSYGRSLHDMYDRVSFDDFTSTGNEKLSDLARQFYKNDFKKVLMVGYVKEDQMEGTETHLLTNLYEVGITQKMTPSLIKNFYGETIGSFKYAMAALMLLDERIKRQLVTVPPTHRIINGKQRTIAKHEVVTIDLDMPSIRKVYDATTPSGFTMIQHDVSSHWITYDLSSQCQHVWVPYTSEEAIERDRKFGHPEPLRRETCILCGGRRTRKPPFVSGDASKGSTVGKKSYRVVASKEKQK